jgi:hypothetical protein
MNRPSVPGHSFRSQLTTGLAASVEEASSSLTEDLKLFATFWLGGVVFFGTFLA